MQADVGTTPPPIQEPSLWFWGATFVALSALAGTIYLTVGMGLKACPLCLYQRAFIMGIVAALVVGLFLRDVRPASLGLLVLPMASAGLGIVLWHEYLVQTGALECPRGVLGIGTAPQQSLLAFGGLVALLIIDQLRLPGRIGAAVAALIIGGVIAFASIRTAQPPIPDYALPVDEDMCRKPKPAAM